MSDDQDKPLEMTDRQGFAETPSKDEWLGLLRDLSDGLATMDSSARDMRERIAIILNRLDKG